MNNISNFKTISEEYEEILSRAREVLRPVCRVCRVCNGINCTGTGGTEMLMGGKGANTGFQNNFRSLAAIRIITDVIHEDYIPDTSITLFGRQFAQPVFAAPIGKFLLKSTIESPFFNNNAEYGKALIRGCRKAGGMAWLGDNLEEGYFEGQISALPECGGLGIPTIKPWEDNDLLIKRVRAAQAVNAMAIAIDLDSIGLSYQSSNKTGVRTRSLQELKELVKMIPMPLIIKGILSAKSAEKAAEAGVKGIVVSNHGGNVIEHSANPADVLPHIRRAVGPGMVIFADGAVRSGEDAFKLLALGADAVLIGRPYAISVYGGGERGAEVYTRKLQWELQNIMRLADCRTVSDIDASRIVSD